MMYYTRRRRSAHIAPTPPPPPDSIIYRTRTATASRKDSTASSGSGTSSIINNKHSTTATTTTTTTTTAQTTTATATTTTVTTTTATTSATATATANTIINDASKKRASARLNTSHQSTNRSDATVSRSKTVESASSVGPAGDQDHPTIIEDDRTIIDLEDDTQEYEKKTDQVETTTATTDSYERIIANSSFFNKRLIEDRKSRLPFIDNQTGVAQTNCNLWRSQSDRLSPKQHGQIISYPAAKWFRKKRSYCTQIEEEEQEFYNVRDDVDAHTNAALNTSVESQPDSDSYSTTTEDFHSPCSFKKLYASNESIYMDASEDACDGLTYPPTNSTNKTCFKGDSNSKSAFGTPTKRRKKTRDTRDKSVIKTLWSDISSFGIVRGKL